MRRFSTISPRSIVEDRRPRFDGRDGSAAGVIMDAVYRSSEAGGWVDLEPAAEGGCCLGVSGRETRRRDIRPQARERFRLFHPYVLRGVPAAGATRSRPSRGKWMFRDLLPGMSDFDARFIVSDDMTCDDWCRMSTAVGEAHHALCAKYPIWARILEHLPGVKRHVARIDGGGVLLPRVPAVDLLSHVGGPSCCTRRNGRWRSGGSMPRTSISIWAVSCTYFRPVQSQHRPADQHGGSGRTSTRCTAA